jgi:hypothetical protein
MPRVNQSSVAGQWTMFRDFFTTNECRDLIFHVQEHRVTLL